MPVERFRTLEDARRAMEDRVSPAPLEVRVRALFALMDALSPNRYPRGVRKFRSIEEAARDRELAARPTAE